MRFEFLLFYLIFSRKIKGDETDCKSSVFIQDCDAYDYIKKLSKTVTNEIVCIHNSICQFKDIQYDWFIRGPHDTVPMINNPYKNILFLKAYSLETNEYIIEVVVREIDFGNKARELAQMCKIVVKPEKPLASILGGEELILPADTAFTVSSSGSRNMDLSVQSVEGLKFSWNCTLNGKQSGFCAKTLGKSDKILVPSEYAIDSMVYVFTLGVKTDKSDEDTYSQTITIKKGAVPISILCVKNCKLTAPLSNTDSLTFFEAEIPDKSLPVRWTVNISDFDYEKNTQFGRDDFRLSILPKVFSYGKCYKISVEYRGNIVGAAACNLCFYPPPHINNCTITPNSGIAMNTYFELSCDYTGLIATWSLRTIDHSGQVVFLAQKNSLEQFEFLLPQHIQIQITGTDYNMLSDVYRMDINVQPEFNPDDSRKRIETQVSEQLVKIRMALEHGDYDMAVQIIDSLMVELEPIKNIDDLKTNVQIALLDDLKKIPTLDIPRIMQVATLADMIVWKNWNNMSNPDIAIRATSICRKMANRLLEEIQKMPYPKTLEGTVYNNSRAIFGCLQANLLPNEKAITPEKILFDITTPDYLLPSDIIEDYPDYQDDSESSINLENYEQSTINYNKGCTDVGLSVLKTMAIGQSPVFITGNFCNVTVWYDYGKYIYNRTMESSNIKIKVSDDFANKSGKYYVILCIANHNPYWFSNLTLNFITKIISLKFYDGQNNIRLREFKKPFDLIMNTIPFEKILHEFSINNFTILRIEVMARESFYVKFHNITEEDELKIVFGDFFKPVQSDLENGYTVNATNTLFYVNMTHSYDVWYYMAVQSVNKPSTTIVISVYNVHCRTRSPQLRSWRVICTATYDAKNLTIYCKCWYTSIFSGVSWNNVVRDDTESYELQFAMVLITNWILFIFLVLGFGLYCLIIVLVLQQVESLQNVYLLADSVISDCYAYLIIIRTGDKIWSGTTSNIMIQLFGKNSNGRPHVLNYPDPDLKMLQRSNEDTFVVLTPKYLGDLKKIEMWTDFIGRRPTWYCDEIFVRDLQDLDKSWYFPVKRWLHITPRSRIKLNAIPSNKQPKILPFTKHSLNVSFFLKCTLFLSIYLTTFSIILILNGLPSLELRDGFNPYNAYNTYGTIIVFAILTATITFIIHGPLIFLFRNSQTDIVETDHHCRFSYKITVICWIVLTINILIHMNILIIFAFWLPRATVEILLTAISGSFIIYFLILVNIFSFIMHFVEKTKTKIDTLRSKMPQFLEQLEMQRKCIFEMFHLQQFRSYTKHLYRHLDDQEIRSRQYNYQQVAQAADLLYDIIVFVVLILSLYILALLSRTKLEAASHKHMIALLDGTYTKTMPLGNVMTTEEYFEYLNTTLITAMQSPMFYVPYASVVPGMMNDFQNRIIGIARIRQLRRESLYCEVPDLLKFLGSTCLYDDYDTIPRKKYDRLAHIFSKNMKMDTGVEGYFDYETNFDYVAPMGRTMYNSMVNVLYIVKNKWVDKFTKRMIVEFLAYNANSNVFNSVKIISTRTNTGGIKNKISIHTEKMLYMGAKDDFFPATITTIYAVCIIIFTIRLIQRFINRTVDIWCWMDTLIVIESIAFFSLYFYRSHCIRVFLNTVERTHHNRFISYFRVMFINGCQRIVTAFLVCTATVRLIKLLQFATVFRVMGLSLYYSVAPIVAYMFVNFLFIWIFALSGFIMYSDFDVHFASIEDSLLNLTRLAINVIPALNINFWQFTYPILTATFYSCFILMAQGLNTFLIAILCSALYDAQVESSNARVYNIKNYLEDEYVYYRELFGIRMRGGNGETRLVFPKAFEHRYANCLATTKKRFEAMNLIAMHTLTNRLSPSKMLKLLGCMHPHLDDEPDLFFKGLFHGHRVTLIDDQRLVMMENLAEALLNLKEFGRSEQLKNRSYKTFFARRNDGLAHIAQAIKSIRSIVDNVNVLDE